MEGLVGVSWREDGGGGDAGGGVEARDLGGTGDAYRGGVAGEDGGMGLSAVSSDHALLPLPCGERSPGTERARGCEVAQQGRAGERGLVACGLGRGEEAGNVAAKAAAADIRPDGTRRVDCFIAME